MTELGKLLDPHGPAAGLVRQLRPDVPRLVESMVDQIQGEVPAYAGPTSGGRRRLIMMAAGAAINTFLDLVDGTPTNTQRVDDLFRRMGHGEAADGNDLSHIRMAIRISTRDAWDKLRAYTTEHETSAALLGHLGDGLFGYVEHLAEQVEIGFDSAQRTANRDVGGARSRLLEGLLAGAPNDTTQAHASDAVWPLPESFVVMSATFHGGFPTMVELEPRTLPRIDSSPALFVCSAADSAEIIALLQHHVTGIRIAISWPVTVDEIPDARRWTERTLRLVGQGVIAPIPVIYCADHSIQLWLHAEPSLRRRQCQELLKPLLSETPNSREILSETLLAWLETRDSAPAIAARLGVHPQTVRYRWKRINELFGEDLRDSESVVQLTMLLKASIPLWRAGDQSDFDLSQGSDGE